MGCVGGGGGASGGGEMIRTGPTGGGTLPLTCNSGGGSDACQNMVLTGPTAGNVQVACEGNRACYSMALTVPEGAEAHRVDVACAGADYGTCLQLQIRAERAAARPSAAAGSWLLPTGPQASRKASADCA